MNEIGLKIIADYYGPWEEKFGIPRQAGLVQDVPGQVVLRSTVATPEHVRGLEAFSHLWLLWVFSEHLDALATGGTVRPPRLHGNQRIGVFATRSSYRPNPIGMSVVSLEQVEIQGAEIKLHVRGADLMNKTPIVDIKPYIPYADSYPHAKASHFQDRPPRLPVNWGAFYSVLEDEVRAVIEASLALDPRPAFHPVSERIYGMQYGAWNIRFQRLDTEILVVDVEVFRGE